MRVRASNPHNLPPRLYRRDGKRVITWWFKSMYGRTEVLARVPVGSTPEAIAAAAELAIFRYPPLADRHREPPPKREPRKRPSQAVIKEVSEVALPAWAWRLFKQTKQHAKGRRIMWRLTQADFAEVVRRANGRCEVSGIELQMPESKARGPYGPSIDRIESSKSYSGDNIRIVCVAANLALNRWGMEIFAPVAHGLSELHSKVQKSHYHVIKNDSKEMAPDMAEWTGLEPATPGVTGPVSK